jgi:hypothetical protein
MASCASWLPHPHTIPLAITDCGIKLQEYCWMGAH